MSQIYIPIPAAVDEAKELWKRRLTKPEHWSDGYSAEQTATSWLSANGFPDTIQKIFDRAGDPFSQFTAELVAPEHPIKLEPVAVGPTQPDVWVLASHKNGLASIAVEGKKDEDFGPLLGDWLKNASDDKINRLAFIKRRLHLSCELPNTLRYQFLHRTAGALVEAERFHANIAVLLVQSFSDKNAGYTDYEAFLNLYGRTTVSGEPVLLDVIDGVALYAAWVRTPVVRPANAPTASAL